MIRSPGARALIGSTQKFETKKQNKTHGYDINNIILYYKQQNKIASRQRIACINKKSPFFTLKHGDAWTLMSIFS